MSYITTDVDWYALRCIDSKRLAPVKGRGAAHVKMQRTGSCSISTLLCSLSLLCISYTPAYRCFTGSYTAVRPSTLIAGQLMHRRKPIHGATADRQSGVPLQTKHYMQKDVNDDGGHASHSLLGIDWERALHLIGNTEQTSGVSPLTVIYNAALNTYEREGKGDMALQVFTEMLEKKAIPDLITFTAVLSACEKADMPNEVLELYESMRHTSIRPDKTIYNIVLTALCKDANADEAISLFEHMLKDVSIDEVNVNCYANVISACEKQQKIDEAFRYYNVMRNQSMPVSLYVINCLFSLCEQTGSAGAALNLYRQLKQEYSIKPNLKTFNHLLSVLADTHRVRDMQDVWNELQEAYGELLPNFKTYERILRGYSNVGNWQKAIQVLNEFLQSGNKVESPMIFMHALQACKEGGEWSEGVRLLRIMQQFYKNPPAAAYQRVLAACAAAENWETLLQLYAEWQSNNNNDTALEQDNSMIAYVLMAYYHTNQSQPLQQMTNLLTSKTNSLHPLTQKILISFNKKP